MLSDPNLPGNNAAYTQVQRGKVAGYSVRTKRWRYTEWDGGREGVELYDHETDAGEYYNLAGKTKYTDTIANLKKLLRLQRGTPAVSRRAK